MRPRASSRLPGNGQPRRAEKSEVKMPWFRVITFGLFVLLVRLGSSTAADLESARRAYEQKEYAVAAPLFLDLAEQGSEEAQLAIGRMYMTGQGVQPDRAAAIKWLSAA